LLLSIVSNEATRRVVAVILDNLNGLKETEAQVIVIAATNKPELISSAFKRAGRIRLR